MNVRACPLHVHQPCQESSPPQRAEDLPGPTTKALRSSNDVFTKNFKYFASFHETLNNISNLEKISASYAA